MIEHFKCVYNQVAGSYLSLIVICDLSVEVNYMKDEWP